MSPSIFTTELKQSREHAEKKHFDASSYMRKWRANNPDKVAAFAKRNNAQRKAKHRAMMGLDRERTMVCEYCGKTFVIAIGLRNRRFCSVSCCRMMAVRNYRSRLAAAAEAPTSTKKTPIPSPSSSAVVTKTTKRNGSVLTAAEKQAVISAQNGPRDLLWEKSKHWTAAQRKFAQERYKRIYND